METTVELRNVPGTGAAMGWADGHTVVIDRPEGKAGGSGLGFSGAQMLALAMGGCFCNSLRFAAEALGIEVDTVEVTVTVKLGGEPLVTQEAHLAVHCTRKDGGDVGGRRFPWHIALQFAAAILYARVMSARAPASIRKAAPSLLVAARAPFLAS